MAFQGGSNESEGSFSQKNKKKCFFVVFFRCAILRSPRAHFRRAMVRDRAPYKTRPVIWSDTPQKDGYDSAVFTHLKDSGHTFNTKDVLILDREEGCPRGHQRKKGISIPQQTRRTVL